MGAATLVILITGGAVIPVSIEAAARSADRELGVNDALSTSLQFADLGGVFGDEIRVRADSVAGSHTAQSAVPLRISRGPLAAVAAASLAALCVMLLTDPAERTISVQEAEMAALEVEADRLRARSGELLGNASASEDQAEFVVAA